jgi:hypothetical protein
MSVAEKNAFDHWWEWPEESVGSYVTIAADNAVIAIVRRGA